MLKAIVFCADGTWNGPESSTGISALDSDDVHGELLAASVTNVVKLYANLAGQVTPETLRLNDEQEKVFIDGNGRTVQVAKYLHGVGDDDNVAVKLIGGVRATDTVDVSVRNRLASSAAYRPRALAGWLEAHPLAR